jgi:protein-tyrosine phosphatase
VPGEHAPTETVLVVCSANQCRSPLAAAILRRALDGAEVDVLDAGTGESGFPVTEETLTTASHLGVDLSKHLSTTLAPGLVDAADLVLTMERAHVRTIVLDDPDAWSKTFTLKEFVRRGDAVGPRTTGQSLAEWLRTVQEGRNRGDLLGTSPLDDVADPTSDRRADHASLAEELDELIAATVELAWPDAARR